MNPAAGGLRKTLSLLRGIASAKVSRWTGRRPSGPLFAFVEVNQACNNRCLYCSIWKSPKGTRAGLPTDVLKQALEDLAGLGCLFVDFFGGEPLLRPDLPELCAHASSLGMHATVTTNGRLLTREKISELREARLDQVLITVAGASPETHDRMVGVPGAFDQLRAGARRLRSEAEGIFTGFNTFISARNFAELPDVVEEAHALGLPCVRFLPFNACFPFDAYGLDPDAVALTPASRERFEPPFREAIERARRYGLLTNSDIFLAGIPDYVASGKPKPYPCYAGFLFCDIGSDGTVYRCFPSRNEMGSLRQDSFLRIWRSSQARTACTPVVLPRCASCWQSCYVETSVRICFRYLPTLLPALIRESGLFLFRTAHPADRGGQADGPRG